MHLVGRDVQMPVVRALVDGGHPLVIAEPQRRAEPVLDILELRLARAVSAA
jgi:hypothetical protein